jgi:DNA repair protein RadC
MRRAKAALDNDTAAGVIAHDPRSGASEPSHAGELITRRLRDALALVDMQLLDHGISAGGETVSFAERGLL